MEEITNDYNYEETSEEIQKRMLSKIDPSKNTRVGSFPWDVTRPGADEFVERNSKMFGLSKMKDIEFLEKDELTRYVYQTTAVERKLAVKASTIITFIGNQGMSVNIGDIVASEEMDYELIEEAVIDETGTAQAMVVAKEYGSIGNCEANAINIMPRTLTGITSLSNEEAVTNGYDEETDENLRSRYYEKLRNPGQSGNEAHYREWSNKIEGVGYADVTKCWAGPLTVKVTLIDRNGIPATRELVEEVENYILTHELPVGAEVTVEAAIEEEMIVSAELKLLKNWEIEDVTKEIKRKLISYFRDVAFQSDEVSYAKVGCIVLNTDGVEDYTELKVNDKAENIFIARYSVPVVGTLDFKEV